MLADATSRPLSAGVTCPTALISGRPFAGCVGNLRRKGRARVMQAYRDLAKRHPSFRERSETTGLVVEISLQPWRSFQPDGVILFRHVRTCSIAGAAIVVSRQLVAAHQTCVCLRGM